MFESLQPRPPPSSSGWRWVRWAVRLLVVLAALPFVAYGLLLAFLQLSLPGLISSQPERLTVSWDIAWPGWGGEVEVRNLAIRSQGPVDQWFLQVDHVRARIDLHELWERTLAATEVRASGVSFLYRVRRATPEEVSPLLPPIPGLTNPPSPSPEDIYPPPPEPWRILLTDVAVERVREVWVEDYHFVGRARARGELDLTPTRWLQVDAARLELEDGQLLWGDQTVAAAVNGELNLALDGSDPTTHVGSSLFGVMTVRTTATAKVRSLVFLDSYLAKAPWLRFEAGAGGLDVDLGVERGRILPDSRLTATLADIDARLFSYRVRGQGRVSVEVGEAPGATMVADFSNYTIVRDGDSTPHVEGEGFRVTATSASAGLDGVATDDLRIVVELPDSAIRDLAVYNAYLPQDMGLAIEKGSGRVHGKLTVTTADNRGFGELVLRGSRVRLRLDDLTLGGDFTLHARVPSSRIDRGRYDVSGTRLELRDVTITDPNAAETGRGARGWWAVATAPEGQVHVGAEEYLDARLRLSLRDSAPLVTIFASKSTLPKWVLNLLTVEGIRGHGRLRLGADSLTIPTVDIQGGQFDVELALRRERDDVRGKLYARWGPLGLSVWRESGKNVVKLVNARRWYDDWPKVE